MVLEVIRILCPSLKRLTRSISMIVWGVKGSSQSSLNPASVAGRMTKGLILTDMEWYEKTILNIEGRGIIMDFDPPLLPSCLSGSQSPFLSHQSSACEDLPFKKMKRNLPKNPLKTSWDGLSLQGQRYSLIILLESYWRKPHKKMFHNHNHPLVPQRSIPVDPSSCNTATATMQGLFSGLPAQHRPGRGAKTRGETIGKMSSIWEMVLLFAGLFKVHKLHPLLSFWWWWCWSRCWSIYLHTHTYFVKLHGLKRAPHVLGFSWGA